MLVLFLDTEAFEAYFRFLHVLWGRGDGGAEREAGGRVAWTEWIAGWIGRSPPAPS